MWRVRRLHCLLMGCYVNRETPDCGYCGAQLYGDEDFRETGPVAQWIWAFQCWRRQYCSRCAVCRKRLWFKKNPWCSAKCYEDYCPF